MAPAKANPSDIPPAPENSDTTAWAAVIRWTRRVRWICRPISAGFPVVPIREGPFCDPFSRLPRLSFRARGKPGEEVLLQICLGKHPHRVGLAHVPYGKRVG